MQTMFVAGTAVNQEVGLVTQFDVKPFRQQPVQITICFAEVGGEVTEIYPYSFSACH